MEMEKKLKIMKIPENMKNKIIDDYVNNLLIILLNNLNYFYF